MNALIDPLKNGAIALPGAHQITLTGIVFAGEPTNEEFARIVAIAQTIDRVQAWVVGDVLVEWVRREQHARPGMTTGTLIAEYALAHGMQVDTARYRHDVAKFYPHPSRVNLTWTHHHFLWASLGDLPKCRAWLAKAIDAGWTVEELRAQFKLATRPPPSNEPDLPGLCPQWLRTAIDHASGHLSDVDTMPIEQAQGLLDEAEPLVAYIDGLRARVATPAKESIEPAA